MANYLKPYEDFEFVESDDGFGNALWLKTSWADHFLDLIDHYKIADIRLTDGPGSVNSDISFLLKVPDLRSVSIISDGVTDVSAVFQLKNLRSLSLFCRNAGIAGDFGEMMHLKSVALEWRNVYRSVFGLGALSKMVIFRYPDRDLTKWDCNVHLEELFLSSNRLESLKGIERFPNIRDLELFRCRKLTSLETIEVAASLRKLRLGQCPGVSELSPISRLTELRTLEMESCREIQSLKPIANCKKLRRLQVAGETTILDGDLRFLFKLPDLKEILLRHRKHYSHTDDELERNIPAS